MLVDKCFALPFHEGDIGLELEVEASKELPIISTSMWTTKNEGSLRGYGKEYITTGALYNNPKKTKVIDDLIKQLPISSISKDCPRTSLHVHVNVQKYSLNQLYSIICAYWLLENILVKFCGEELREGNHFCLRLQDAEWTLKTLVKDLQKEQHFMSFHNNKHYRYSALNLAAVPKFGSVEFRSMRGTCDPKLIDQWSSELHYLCAFAKKKFPRPSELLDKYFSTDKEEFLSLFFSGDFVKELSKIKHWKELISENEGPVCELAYARDWSKPFEKLLDKKNTIKIPRVNTGVRPRALRHRWAVMPDAPVGVGGRDPAQWQGNVWINGSFLNNYNWEATAVELNDIRYAVHARRALNINNGRHETLVPNPPGGDPLPHDPLELMPDAWRIIDPEDLDL